MVPFIIKKILIQNIIVNDNLDVLSHHGVTIIHFNAQSLNKNKKQRISLNLNIKLPFDIGTR